jgi:hypothetical protein
LGGLELKLRHFPLAEQLFQRELIGVQKLYGMEKREVVAVLENLAEVAENSGRTQDAAALRAKAKQIRHKLCDEC